MFYFLLFLVLVVIVQSSSIHSSIGGQSKLAQSSSFSDQLISNSFKILDHFSRNQEYKENNVNILGKTLIFPFNLLSIFYHFTLQSFRSLFSFHSSFIIEGEKSLCITHCLSFITSFFYSTILFTLSFKHFDLDFSNFKFYFPP